MLKLTDYKIRSKEIFWGISFSFSAIIFLTFLAEILVDLRVINLFSVSVFFALTILDSVLAIKMPEANWVKHLHVVLIVVFLEFTFLLVPTSFHSILFWLPIVPLAGMIILGLRAAFVWFVIVLALHTFNSLYLKYDIGDVYEVKIGRIPFYVVGIIFITAMFSCFYLLYQLLGNAYDKMKEKSEEAFRLKASIEAKNSLLETYFNTITDLYKNEFYAEKSSDGLYKMICWSISNTLEINRVSIWFFDKTKTCIERAFLYESFQESSFESKEKITLYEKDFPAYFKAVNTKRMISANDASIHPDTLEFKDSYLVPNEIISMLDCPIIFDTEIVGVICCENKFEQKNWKIEDTIFLQSLSDFISIHFKNEKISELMNEVKTQNLELYERSNKIEAMNEELNSLVEELNALNESLEDKVNIRTHELKIQNEHLSEYAFINSHLLRAPIARMLGLANLIKMDNKLANDVDVIESLVNSTKEVDDIVKKISDILHEGEKPTRSNIDNY